MSVLPTAGDDGGTGSTPAPEASDASPVRIRRYEPRDREQVVAIFSTGMLGLIPALCWHVLTAGGVAASAAAATAALMGAVGARAHAPWPVLGLAVAGGAVSVPIAAWLFARNAMRDYVRGSLQTDLRDISTFYSDTGAGPGSAFWVAERVDDGQVGYHGRGQHSGARSMQVVQPACLHACEGAVWAAHACVHACMHACIAPWRPLPRSMYRKPWAAHGLPFPASLVPCRPLVLHLTCSRTRPPHAVPRRPALPTTHRSSAT